MIDSDLQLWHFRQPNNELRGYSNNRNTQKKNDQIRWKEREDYEYE